jgi:hypothetical protein
LARIWYRNVANQADFDRDGRLDLIPAGHAEVSVGQSPRERS